MALLDLERICCAYGEWPALREVSLQIERGDIAALLGPSGSGKTTALRAVMGFEPLQEGVLRIDGEVMATSRHSVPPERRPVGMVFQDRALFPHMTIETNIAVGIRHRPRAEQKRITGELLEITRLTGYGEQYPHELSGGQQARVALARALAPRPRLLLLDEPFASLDEGLRERLSVEVRQILKETESTALLVTHHHQEAFAMGDQVGVIMEGRLQQWAPPYDIYHRPVSRQVATFVGRSVSVPAVLRSGKDLETELGVLNNAHAFPQPAGAQMEVMLRPDDVLLDDHGPIRATVVGRVFKGDRTLYTLRLPSGLRLLAVAPSHNDLPLGSTARARLDLEHLVVFPAH